MLHNRQLLLFFFFNDTATTEIYTLSLHDALPIWITKEYLLREFCRSEKLEWGHPWLESQDLELDRKSTRLNSSHLVISYAVFCLKKKKIASCMTWITAMSGAGSKSDMV